MLQDINEMGNGQEMTEAIAKCEKYKIPYLGPSFKPQIF